MPTEKNFELLDDFMSNRLSGPDQVAFEEKLQSDPELKQELKFQQNLIEGIRKARVAELKSMLNNIPISSIPTGNSAIVKIGALVVVVSIVATSLYFFLDNNIAQEQPASESVIETPKEGIPTINKEPVEKTESNPIESTEKLSNTKREEPKTVAPAPVKKPTLEVFDPTAETGTPNSFNAREQIEIVSKAFVTSSIVVEIDSDNKSYKFHYVFRNGKLVLFGILEKDLYEILEFINGEKRTVFLYYKANYYWLDVTQSRPSPLLPLKDQTLLKKLKEYRGD